MKKTYVMIMTLMLCICFSLNVKAQQTVTSDGITYDLNDEGLLSITGTGEVGRIQQLFKEDSAYKKITRCVIGNGITGIGYRAFHNCIYMETVDIPSSVKTINEGAFRNCLHIEAITIPNTVTDMGPGVFYLCTRLKDVKLPDGLTMIPDDTFNNCESLENITFPANITKIGSAAFCCCYSLQSITFPARVTEIGDRAFQDCNILHSITFPTGIKKIGDYAFSCCATDDEVWEGDDDTGHSVHLYDRIDLVLPEGLQSIGEGCFDGMMFLTSISIPSTVVEIGKNVFFGESMHLEQITVAKNNPKYCSEDNVLFNKDKTELIYFMRQKTGTYAVPNTVTRIADYAFLESALTGITMSSNVKSIGKGAFSYSMLKSLAFPEGITCIEDETFYACSQLESIYIPASVNDLGRYNFEELNSLKEIHYAGTKEQWEAIGGIEDLSGYMDNGMIQWNSTSPSSVPSKPAAKPKTQSAKSIKVNKLRLSGISKKIAAGKKIKLTAKVLPQNAANKKLKWTSNNKKVATVTQTGLVKIKKKAGGKKVKITAAATDGSGKKAVWKIKVMKGAVKKITVKAPAKTIKAGKTMKLKAVVRVKKGKPVNKKLKWSTNNKKYATVTQTGKVKASGTGKGKKVKVTVMSTDGTNIKKTMTIKIQ